jgi:hypothetical protein
MEHKEKGSQPVFHFAGGFLALFIAAFYGMAEAWARFGFCLVLASILLICALQESQYRRFLRRLDELKGLISNKQTKEENERVTEKIHEEASKGDLS